MTYDTYKSLLLYACIKYDMSKKQSPSCISRAVYQHHLGTFDDYSHGTNDLDADPDYGGIDTLADTFYQINTVD